MSKEEFMVGEEGPGEVRTRWREQCLNHGICLLLGLLAEPVEVIPEECLEEPPLEHKQNTDPTANTVLLQAPKEEVAQ